MADDPPITVKETRAAARWTLGMVAATTLIPASLGTVIMATAGPESADLQEVFFPLWLGFFLVVMTWLMFAGQIGGTAENLSIMLRREVAAYRGIALFGTGFSLLTLGIPVGQVWRPAGLALIGLGALLAIAGLVVGSLGRPLWLLPRPLRQLGEVHAWSADYDVGPPELYPALVEHIHWLRRMRAKLFGGDPRRPLGRAGRLAAKLGAEASSVEELDQPQITLKEAWAAGRYTLALAALAGLPPAALGAIVVPLIRPDDVVPSAVFLPLWLGFALLAFGWASFVGRLNGTGDALGRMTALSLVMCRGVALTVPGYALMPFGGVALSLWRPGGLALLALGVVLLGLGALVGWRGCPRWLLPVPLRDRAGEPLRSLGKTAAPTDFPPVFVEHVHWLRRVRAKLFGGDPRRPLGRAGRAAAKKAAQVSPTSPSAPSDSTRPQVEATRRPASLWSDDLAATRRAEAERADCTARPRSPKGLRLRASGRRPAPGADEPER